MDKKSYVKNFIVYSIVILLGVISGFLLNFLENDNFGMSYFLVFVLFLLCSLPFIISFRQKKFDVWSLVIVISALYFLYFGIRMIFVMWNNSQFLDIMENLHYFNIALTYSIIGFFMMLAGYYGITPIIRKIAKNRKLFHLPAEWDRRRALIAIFLLYLTGLFFRLIIILRGELLHIAEKEAQFIGLLFHLSLLAQYSFILMMIYFYKFGRRKLSLLLLLLVMLSIELLYAITALSKLYIIIVLLIPFIIHHYLKGRVPLKFYCIFLLLFILLHPLIAILVSRISLTADMTLPWQDVKAELSNFLADEPFIGAIKSFMGRYHGIDSMAAIVRFTPQVMDYMRGESIASIVISVIPRFIWPDKPPITFGDVFGEKYLGMKTTSSYIITFPGEMYLNFGFVGIIIGMLLLGVFYRLFYFYFIEYSGRNISGVFVYTTSFFYLVYIENTISTVFSALIKVLFISFLIIFTVGKRDKS